MSMMKKRAEAARRKRIDHVFVKADDNSNGKITPQQMIKLFTANGEVNILSLYSRSSSGSKSCLHEFLGDKLKQILVTGCRCGLRKRCKRVSRKRWLDTKTKFHKICSWN